MSNILTSDFHTLPTKVKTFPLELIHKIASYGDEIGVYYAFGIVYDIYPSITEFEKLCGRGFIDSVKLCCEKYSFPLYPAGFYNARKGCQIEIIRYFITNNYILTNDYSISEDNLEFYKEIRKYYPGDNHDLEICAKFGFNKIFDYLLECGKEPTQIEMEYSFVNGNFHVFLECWKHGLRPGPHTVKLVISNGNYDIIKFLMDNGYSFNENHLDLAITKYQFRIAHLFLTHGLKPSTSAKMYMGSHPYLLRLCE